MSNKRKYFIYCQLQKLFNEVDKDYYYGFYREIWKLRKQLQRSGECVCPKCDSKYCDGDCFECEHHRSLTCSLEQLLDEDSDISLDGAVGDTDSLEKMFEQAELHTGVAEVLSTLSTEDKIICFAIMEGLNNRELMRLLNYSSSEGNFSCYKARHLLKLQKKFKKFR